MLTLNSYPPAFGQASASPFCVKAMCLLNMAGLYWQPDFTTNPSNSPMQKLPVLLHDDAIIADSDNMRRHIEKTTGFDFDAGLNTIQRATSRAIIRMVEEHMYFAIVCDRWLDEGNWQHIKDTFFAAVPAPARAAISDQARDHVRGQLTGQGMARHSAAERVARLETDFIAISDLLDDQRFMFGAKPSAADASVASMLGALINSPSKTALSARVIGDKKLVDYVGSCEKALL